MLDNMIFMYYLSNRKWEGERFALDSRHIDRNKQHQQKSVSARHLYLISGGLKETSGAHTLQRQQAHQVTGRQSRGQWGHTDGRLADSLGGSGVTLMVGWLTV